MTIRLNKKMADLVKDILTDDDGDLIIKNGDIVIGESDYQHIQDIIIAAPGDYKQYPLIGANIRMQQNGSIDGDFRKLLRLQLESDGYSVSQIQEINGILNIEAERK